MKVLVVDDQPIVREGIRAMLSLEPDITVVGEAANGQEALRQAPLLAPDIILLDVRMPEMDGLAALERLKRLCPKTSIIMLTLYDNFDYLLQAVMAGAAGYMLKDSSREELIKALRIIHDGGAIIEPTMLPQLLQRISQLNLTAPHTLAYAPGEPLTEREREVLGWIAEGCTNQEIADKLYLSPTTVKTHVQNILQKLGVSDRTQAAVMAVRSGLL